MASPSLSTTTASSPVIAPGAAVDPNRKQALLLKARRARVAWVDEVSTSSRRQTGSNSSSSRVVGVGDGSGGGDYMKTLKSVKACESMKSAVDVLSFLYGTTAAAAADGGLSASQAEKRVLRQLESQMSADDIRKAMLDYPSSSSLTTSAAAANNNNIDPFEIHFQQFLQKLRSPECAELVQGMRHFVHSIEDMVTSIKKEQTAAAAKVSSKKSLPKKKQKKNDATASRDISNILSSDKKISDGGGETTTKKESKSNEAQEKEKDHKTDSEEEQLNDQQLEKLAKAIRTYLDNTYETILSHTLWSKKKNKGSESKEEKNNDVDVNRSENDAKNKENVDNMTKLSLETFIFARCYDAIWSILLLQFSPPTTDDDDTTSRMDKLMSDRLQSLQFVTPAHLEIQCLTSKKTKKEKKEKDSDNRKEEGKSLEKDTTDDNDDDDDDDVINLSEPIQSLLSIDDQYSPGRMLHCILDVYRGVNSALSSALASEENPPGADDVLPTLILTVLRAKPHRIISNLKFIELFATPDQLRGEAGYAYTNLYGAVQFLKDLNLDHVDDDSDGAAAADGISLHITQEEFRSGLEKCRTEAKKLRDINTSAAKSKQGENDQVDNDVATMQHMEYDEDGTIIPVQEIRKARMRGETIDLDWARRWQEKHGRTNTTASTNRSFSTNENYNGKTAFDSESNTTTVPPPLLPQGFSRSYTFLSTKAEEVRLSDLPQLLSEYRMLVHATESLLAERTARHNAEYKRHVKETRDRLELDAAEAAAGVSASKKE